MPTRLTADPLAWRADTIDAPARWYVPFPEAALPLLDRAARGSGPITDLELGDDLRAAAAGFVRDVLEALERGRGFVIVAAGRPDQFPPHELTAAYWLVGRLLGRPVVQNVQGTLLYDVRDTGQDVRYGARFSVTNAESTFHTDNSFGDDVLDYVGLLCINPAKSGGLSQLVSGVSVLDALRGMSPEAEAELRRPFHVDRRGGVRPGEPPTAQFPVVAWEGEGLVIRYLRYWIEVGHEKAGAPLTPAQVAALDALDRAAALPGLRVEFALRAGEMLFVNNRRLLHNRTAFADFADPPRKRHLVRLWLRRA
jgi:alpha-ketoglutarate-dependent taurine dioxygenase